MRSQILLLLLLAGCQRSSRAPSRESGPIRIANVTDYCTTLADCERRCASGVAPPCVAAGRLYEFGHETTTDPSHAFQLYQRACLLGDATGCYNVAVLLEAGKGVARDLDSALALYRRVCAMGAKTACAKAEAIRDGEVK